MARYSTYDVAAGSTSWLADVSVLIKMRLTLLVVFTSVFAYAIAAQSLTLWVSMLFLAAGGFLVAGASNAINQILERDYDKMMTRTADRPVASGRMQVSAALVIAGLMLLTGIVILGLFNPLTAFLGMLSFILYAFIYTPLKRYSTFAVSVGAIPGAMPALIGCVAFEGTISMLAIVLFAVQFLWQFPHFWAIGWLSFDQYQNAGFKLVPSKDGNIDPSLGKNTLLYSALILPVVALMYLSGVVGIYAAIGIGVVSSWYVFRSYIFCKQFNRDSARKLMFSSFAYLPMVLIIFLLSVII